MNVSIILRREASLPLDNETTIFHTELGALGFTISKRPSSSEGEWRYYLNYVVDTIIIRRCSIGYLNFEHADTPVFSLPDNLDTATIDVMKGAINRYLDGNPNMLELSVSMGDYFSSEITHIAAVCFERQQERLFVEEDDLFDDIPSIATDLSDNWSNFINEILTEDEDD